LSKEIKKVAKIARDSTLPKEQNLTKKSSKRVSKAISIKVKNAPKSKPTPRKRRKTHLARRRPKGANRRLISTLYGNSYSKMSRSQQDFIDNNLRRIIEISQRTLNYLGYPQEALYFGEEGTNIVEFWLHPNGDISGLRLRKKLPSQSLNHQTLEVIKTAYMYYPHPKTKTKIIIYVRYKLR